MRSGKKGVTFQEFPKAQFASSGPAIEGTESFNGFEFIWHSVRIQEAQTRSHFTNADKARTRAVKLRHAVLTDTALGQRIRDVNVEFVFEAGIPAEQEEEPFPMLPPASANRHEKVVRFSDQVDTQQFSFVATLQCELGSAHELCLNAFAGRIASAKVAPHTVNTSDALDRAWSLQTEVELQQREERSSADAHAILEDEEPWLVIETPTHSDEELLGGPLSKACRSKRLHKPVKKCFWALDARGMPAEVRKSCEGKRWQDQVRQCTAMF